ncbi:flagellar basal-body rod protein FlgG [Carboxydocella sporoproducens DSM 16521]|uniref:Flagellar basal-body rod protein FlgG n=2 Tax=Carboxydocella TaxID=178898 RepID=A0A1T4P1U7_9FIRM|nr:MULTISPECIES: flagellar hook-basal body protein [Carboxydocella]AVX19574.1 flagellar basal-body rod protein FlgG [Carboxydocella thermautotrophica]SJZ85590.1 flagellar basal-body rod protein FlgG [Carboxydocella sporoproducens DSM 16521]
MIRTLWTAASGMTAQQANIDNIANNLANVNTTGYKKTSVEFQDLLYANLRENGRVLADGTTSPINFQLGLGVRVAGIRTEFSKGNLQATNNPFDLALTDDTFFEIRLPNGQVAYTRDGSFKINSEGRIVTVDGYQLSLQNKTADEVLISDPEAVSIAENGSIVMPRKTAVSADIYILKDAKTLVDNGTGFFTGDFEQWQPSDSQPNPPKDRYFKVEMPDGSEAYVRAGSFKVDSEGNIVTSLQVADGNGGFKPARLVSSSLPEVDKGVVQVDVGDDGKFVLTQEVGLIRRVRFTNPQGLEKRGQNLYFPTAASGPAETVSEDQAGVMSGFIETSNVQVAEEMVKMIMAQRAYELNSKAIQTADDMMQVANQLKR